MECKCRAVDVAVHCAKWYVAVYEEVADQLCSCNAAEGGPFAAEH